jgi:hypothetical protein
MSYEKVIDFQSFEKIGHEEKIGVPRGNNNLTSSAYQCAIRTDQLYKQRKLYLSLRRDFRSVVGRARTLFKPSTRY